MLICKATKYKILFYLLSPRNWHRLLVIGVYEKRIAYKVLSPDKYSFTFEDGSTMVCMSNEELFKE